MILALLSKPTGRGGLRCWSGFLFDTDVQSEVEEFMCTVHQNKYFLMDPRDLETITPGHLLLGGLWVYSTPVHVKTKGTRTSYTIKA